MPQRSPRGSDRIGGRVPRGPPGSRECIARPESDPSRPAAQAIAGLDTAGTADGRARAVVHRSGTGRERTVPPGQWVDWRAPTPVGPRRSGPPARGGPVARCRVGTTMTADRCRAGSRSTCTIGHRRNPLSRRHDRFLVTGSKGKPEHCAERLKQGGGYRNRTRELQGSPVRDERNGQRARDRASERVQPILDGSDNLLLDNLLLDNLLLDNLVLARRAPWRMADPFRR